jgi:anti-sigma factor RsiW
MLGGRRCEQHRGALLDFADTREVRPATAAALEHLGRCPECVRELEVTALAIVGLRRLYDEVKAIEPPLDTWERLRSRVTRPATPTYGLRSPVLGVVTAWALVAAIGVQAVILPGVTQRDPGPVQLTSRDAFEPGVRYVSTGRILTTSTVPRQHPDRDGTLSALLAPTDRGRRVSNA